MAHHKSAVKRIQRNAHRASINTARTSRLRTFVRKVEEAIAGGNRTAAAEALRAAQPELAKGGARGIVSVAAASRKVSRLAARVKAMPA